MKGISAVLATVLIVVITVAIIGLAYGWATGLFETVSSSSDDQVSGITDDLQKSVDIIAATCDNVNGVIYFTIKNTGTLEIPASELTAFVDDVLINEANDLGWEDENGTWQDGFANLEAGTTSSQYEIWHPTDTYNGTVVLKIDAPAGDVEETVECP